MYICERARESKLAEEKLQLFSQVPSIKNNGTEFKDKKNTPHSHTTYNGQSVNSLWNFKCQILYLVAKKNKHSRKRSKKKEKQKTTQHNPKDIGINLSKLANWEWILNQFLISQLFSIINTTLFFKFVSLLLQQFIIGRAIAHWRLH